MSVGCQRLLQVAPLASIGEIFDEFGCGREQCLEAVLDGSISDGYRQMSLAATSLAVQDQRASLSDEVEAEVGTDHGFSKCYKCFKPMLSHMRRNLYPSWLGTF